MEFKSIYVRALRDRNPKLFRELVKTGQIDQHLQEKTGEAHDLLHQLIDPLPKGVDGLPKDQQAQNLAEEQVRAQMIDDIPLPEERQPRLEPPDDLPDIDNKLERMGFAQDGRAGFRGTR